MKLRSGRSKILGNESKLPRNPQKQKSPSENQTSDRQPLRDHQPQTSQVRTPTLRNQQRSSLEDFYTNLQNPLAFSGNTREILNTLEGYSLHKPRRKIFPRRLTFVPNIFHTIYAMGFK